MANGNIATTNDELQPQIVIRGAMNMGYRVVPGHAGSRTADRDSTAGAASTGDPPAERMK